MNLPFKPAHALRQAAPLLCALAMATAVIPALAQAAATTAQHANQSEAVAITVDDLPGTDDLPPGMSRAYVARSILHTLKTFHAPPVYGFVNAGQLDDGPEDIRVLKMWRAAGLPLGNHTYSHLSADKVTAEEFDNDIAKDEPILKRLIKPTAPAHDWHWFRYPYLAEGETVEKRNAVRAYLFDHHYRVAQVTMSFDDWTWNDPYARCATRQDAQSIAWLKSSYLDTATKSIELSRQISQQLYGRPIKQVLLIHIGAFETVMLPRLLALLRQQGFTLVSLQDAESDPAYQDDPGMPSTGGSTFLEQTMQSRHITPPLVKRPEEKLDTICR